MFSIILELLCCILPAVGAARVSQTLRLTWDQGAPNGQPRDLIYTNGQFPGPALIFDEDDDVEITVINDMSRNTTVHWHGLAYVLVPSSSYLQALIRSQSSRHAMVRWSHWARSTAHSTQRIFCLSVQGDARRDSLVSLT